MILHYAGGKRYSAIHKSACVHLPHKTCQEERKGVALIGVDPGQGQFRNWARTTQRARQHRLR